MKNKIKPKIDERNVSQITWQTEHFEALSFYKG